MALPTSDIDIEQAYLDIAKMEQGTANVDINDAVKRAEELAGDYFAGSGLENQARNYITKAQIAASKKDYSLMYDSNGDFLPQYEQARDIINAPKTSYQTSGSTVVPVITTSTIDFERYERKKPNQKAIDFLKTNDTEENRSAFIEKYGALPEGL